MAKLKRVFPGELGLVRSLSRANEVVDAINKLKRTQITGVGKLDFSGGTPYIELNDVVSRIAAVEASLASTERQIGDAEDYLPTDANNTITNIRKKSSLFCLCGYEPFSAVEEACVRYRTLSFVGEILDTYSVENYYPGECDDPDNPGGIGGGGAGTRTNTYPNSGSYANNTWNAKVSGGIKASYVSESGSVMTFARAGGQVQIDINVTRNGGGIGGGGGTGGIILQQQTAPGSASWSNVFAGSSSASVASSGTFATATTAGSSSGTFTVSKTAGRKLRWVITASLPSLASINIQVGGEFDLADREAPLMDKAVNFTFKELTGSVTKGGAECDTCEGEGVTSVIRTGIKYCGCGTSTSETSSGSGGGCDVLYTLATSGTITSPVTAEITGAPGAECLTDDGVITATLSEPDTPADAIDRATEDLIPLDTIESSLSALDEDCCGEGTAIYFDVCWNNAEVGGTVTFIINVYDVATDTYDEPRTVEYVFGPGIVCFPTSLPMEEGKIISFDPDDYTITEDTP